MSQNDFNIANQGFPATRADINSALQALASTSAGTTEPGTIYAYQFWYDSTANLLKMRNAGNDAWITLAAFDQAADEWEVRTAVVQAVDSAGVVIKTDDGVARISVADSGAVTVANALTVGGNLTVDTNTLFVDAANNRVGVGTTSPTATLTAVTGVSGNNEGEIRVSDNASFYGSLSRVNASDEVRLGSYGASQNLTFYTVASERMRIDASGNVGIGTSSPNRLLHLHTASGTNGRIHFSNTTTGQTTSDGFFIGQDSGDGNVSLWNLENNYLRFATNNTERMRIDASGNLLVGTTSAISSTNSGIATFIAAGDYAILDIGNTRTTSQNTMRFYNGNGQVGSIATNGSSTAYNTSSDYRLKENVVPLAGAADRLAQIPVHRFNFIADPDTTVDGFLAHEVQAFVPEAVTGEKDAVDKDGKPVHQGIDQSKLVPLLTAALQDALQKIEQLETRIAALEA